MNGSQGSGRLAGRVAVITGAGSGIGLAICAGFAREGATVVAVDRTITPGLSRVADDGTVTTREVDVTSQDGIDEVFRTTVTEGSGLDVLVHCAAVQMTDGDSTVGDIDPLVWRQTIEVNLTGTFLTCRAAVNAMLATGRGGSIINCGSPTSLRGSSPDYAAYSSSKGGVHALTRVMATQYGPNGIRVNTLVPGPTLTNLTRAMFALPAVRDPLVARIPLGRLAVAEDYVGAALFLASDESRFVTGSELMVDGGFTIA